MKKALPLLLVLVIAVYAGAQTKTSLLSGNWNNPTIWLPLGVPTGTDDVVISNGTTISVVTDQAVKSVTIGGGISGALNFAGNNPRTFSVSGDLVVRTLAALSTAKNSNVTHTLVAQGNIVNNGTVNLWPDNNSMVSLFFSGPASQTLTSTGPQARFDQVLFSGTGLKVLGAHITTGGFTVQAGASVDVSSNNYSITVSGHFSNNGTFNPRAGTVTFSGTTAQQIGGTKTTEFYDLRVASTSSVTLSNHVNLRNTLSLASGTLFTNAKNFTLLSDATGNARIGQITGGDIQGNVVLQRYVNGGRTGWALLGAPIGPGLTLTSWDDDMAITCKSCPDGYYNFPSIYTYNESAGGTFDDGAAYTPITTINTPLVPGTGYWVYLGTSQFTTAAVNLDMTGAPKKGNVAIPLAYTSNSNVNNDGWNLIANPYPSPISWSALRAANTNVDNAIYAYNADLGGGKGGYATYVNGVSSPAVVSGGIGDVITTCQGFYVHATAPTTLTAIESIKVGGNQQLVRSAAPSRPLLRLTLGGKNRQDEAVLYCEQGAAAGFDKDLDAFKMAGGDPLYPMLALVKDSNSFQVNGVAPVNGTFTMQVKATTGYAGTYTIAAPELVNFPFYACISLLDTKTNVSTDLKKSAYVCQLSAADTLPRFVLTITARELQVTSLQAQPSCINPAGGAIIVSPSSSGPWTYTWKKNGQVVRQVTNSSLSDTYSQLPGGDYELEVYTAGKCDFFTTSYHLLSRTPVFASFLAPDSLPFSGSLAITFSNTTVGANNYSWSFGDGIASSAVYQPSLQVSQPGQLKVSLIASNGSGCSDTVTKVIVITDRSTGLSNETITEGVLLKNFGGGLFQVTTENGKHAEFTLIDNSGKVISRQSEISQANLDLSNFAPALYYLTVSTGEGSKTFKLLR